MNQEPPHTPTHPPTFTPPSHTIPNPAWGDRMPPSPKPTNLPLFVLHSKTHAESIVIKTGRPGPTHANLSNKTISVFLARSRQTYIGLPNVFTPLQLLQLAIFSPPRSLPPAAHPSFLTRLPTGRHTPPIQLSLVTPMSPLFLRQHRHGQMDPLPPRWET